MSNYLIKDISGPKDHKPYPSSEGKTFLKDEEYALAARKIIRKFGVKHPFNLPKYRVDQILSGDDFVVEISNALVLADLTYDKAKSKGKSPYAWRNYRGLRALQECIKADNNQKNRKFQSLDHACSPPLTYSTYDEEAQDIIGKADRKDRVRTWVRWLLDNSGLTPLQKKCIQLRYFDEVKNLTKIGQHFSPPVSRQDIGEKIGKALHKMRLTALGTSEGCSA